MFGPYLAAHRRALIVIGLFVVIGAAYSMVVPPFETPDEPFHYAFARHIAQGNGLPVQSSEATGPWQQEGSQAPLYYLLAGWLTRGIDQNDFAALFVRNPRANIGDPLNPGNKNYLLYSGRQPPLAGSNLALHVGRWLSLLLGAGTLWFVYLTARLALPSRPAMALLAAAFVAAIPQFAFVSGSFTNDNLVIAASAATIYWLARLLAKPDDAPIGWWDWAILGVLLGVAALSKLQGLGLMPVTALVVLFLAWQRRDLKVPLAALLPVVLPIAAIAGWWYARNIMLYGDWSGLSHLMDINGRRGDELALADFWPEFRGLRYSFWGLFGWFNILLPGWFYTVADWLTVVGTLGLAGALIRLVRTTPPPRWQNRSLRIVVLLVVWAAATTALLIYWISQATGSQGRLLFPGIVAFGILLIIGLDFWLQWLPMWLQRVSWGALCALFVGMSLFALVRLLPDSYNALAPVAGVPAEANPVNLTFGDAEPIKLLAVDAGAGRYRPGERVPVTLYLQADRLLRYDYQLFIQLLDETGREVANLTSHPGWGRNPTTLWQPGAIYADPYTLLVAGPLEERSPLLARVYTGLIDPATAEVDNLPLPARTAEGVEVTPFVAAVELSPSHAPELADYDLRPAGSIFGGVLQLAGVQAPGETTLVAAEILTATLLWEATGIPATDYTAYVHLVDADGRQVAGYDRAPAGDRFPTSRWQTGDRVLSEFPLALPSDLEPGTYDLWAGLYESGSGGSLRLPVTEAANLAHADGRVKIGSVELAR